MTPISFNGAAAFLLDDVPEWGRANVVVEATIPSSYERGLTGKETRRNTGDTLRLDLKWTSLIRSPEYLTNLRNSLQALATQPVLCPFWPGGFAAGTMPVITAQWYVLMDASGAPEIQPAGALQNGFNRFAYPLLVGILPEIPEPVLLTSKTATVDFHFAENDNAYFLTPPPFAAPDGIVAASGVRPLFPFAANWVTSPHSSTAEFDIDRQQIGETRALSEIYYNQKNRRRVKQYLTLKNNDPLNLLSFFRQMGGEVQSFWLPSNLKEMWLTADVAATDCALTVDKPSALGTNTFICLNDGRQRVPLIVTGAADNQLILSGAVGAAFSASVTNVESLVLARFDALKLTLNFVHAKWASTTISFKELPWETNAVAGETVGTTMGPLPTTAMLYVFTLTPPGNNTIYRFTNFERNLTDANGAVYLSAPMENDDITDSPNLERQNVNIKSRNFAGNPLALLIPFSLEFPLEVDIYEGDVAGNNVGNLLCYFSGEVGEVDMDGPILTAQCASLSWIFDRTAARRMYQNNDNFNLFEPANGLNPDDWRWNAVVVSYDAATATLVIGAISANNEALNGTTDLAAHYFAAGYVQITTNGKAQYRMVGDSTALTAGQITVNLTSPLTTAPNVGDAVQIFAGYDGQYETAIEKLNNGANFGGFPFIPVGNPFVLKITQNAGAGKK